jgi:hypothetical protein
LDVAKIIPYIFRIMDGRGADRPFFRRSGLPVRVIRSERGWMLSCVSGRDWLSTLLSLLLSGAWPHWPRVPLSQAEEIT